MASIVVSGDTSGAITLQAPAVAGSTTLTLPTTSGTVVVTTGAQTTGQTLISTNSSVPEWKTYNSVYGLPNTDATAKWIYLGRWSNAAQDGRKLEIYINSSAGYNADIGQNQESYLFFKTSNDNTFQAGSSGNFFADGYVRVYSSNQSISPSSIRVVQIDKNTYDFYGFFDNYTGNGSFYRVTACQGTSWTNSSTIIGTSWTVSGNFVALPMMFTYYTVGTGQATPPPYYSARAWVNFDGTGTVGIRASGNVTSITDNANGDYTINFTTAMPDVNYNAVLGVRAIAASSRIILEQHDNVLHSTTQLRIYTLTPTGTPTDSPGVNVTIFR